MPKPIKRHDSLAPLSRHHHHVLVMSLKISKLSAEPSTEEVQALREELLVLWETGGQAHFREEEEILLPAYACYASIQEPIIMEMLLEHVEIRSLVRLIELGEGDVARHIRKLGVSFEQHVRKEERVIFPLIEAALPEDVLQQLKPYFHEHSSGCSL